jgi:hypothetical protein
LGHFHIFYPTKELNLASHKFLQHTLHISLFGICALVLLSHGTHAHYDEWVAAKIYPSIALANGVDLFQKHEGPFILTIYGPASPLFYLPVSLGSSPKECIWIAYALNILVLCGCFYSIFYKRQTKKSFSSKLCLGFGLIFILANNQTTSSLFKIHHDLPVFAYLLTGSFFLLGKYPINPNYRLWLGNFFIWMAFWTKIVALPWLLLPFLQILFSGKHSLRSLRNAFSVLIGTGLISFLLFASLFGASDLWFHLFESTNSYPWRTCNSLFGEGEEALVAHNLYSKVVILLRIMLLYFVQYWWLVIACGLIGFHNHKSKDGRVLFWLILCYFLALPTCLSALAKFGGVANSLVFAHAPAFAAIFLQVAFLIDKIVLSQLTKLSISFLIAIIPAIAGIRVAKAIFKDPAASPLQLGYEYLLENPDQPVYFALAPLPNYLATGKIWSSGEALTYTTMMSKGALPKEAGIDGPKEIPIIAFGAPPYSFTFFNEKFDLNPIPSPDKLRSWALFRANLKAD